MSLEQLGDVEVTTVSKEPTEVWQTPAAIYVLTQEDIRRSGATSIPEALRLVPGVEVARIDSDHWSIGVRGFGNEFSRSLLVLIDGRSVYTPLFAGVYWDVQDTVIEDIDRIEVIRGPGGTIWGSNAVNGVINIITKSAKDTRGTLASAVTGNIDRGIGEVREGAGNGDSFNYRFYGKAFGREPEFHADGDDYDAWGQQRGGFRMDWEDQNRSSLTLQGDVYHGEDGEVTALGSFFPPAQLVLTGNDEVSGGDVLALWKHQAGDSSDLQIQAYWDRSERHAAQYKEARDTFDFDFLHHIKTHWRQDFLWGFGIRVSPGDFTQIVPTLKFVPNHQDDDIYSGFVQDQVQIARTFSLTLGAKIEHNIYTGFEVEPSARLLWARTPRQTFWAAVTRAVRTPSRLDTDVALEDFLLFLPPRNLPTYLEVAGNPNFASEALLGYEAGYRSLITSKLFVDISAFYNDYSKLSSYSPPTISIATSPILYELVTLTFVNGIRGTTKGFEIAPDWKLAQWVELKGSYSYLYPHLFENTAGLLLQTAPTYNGSSPRTQIVGQSLFNLPKRFELDLTYRYVSALPAQAVPSYSTGDVRLGWHARPALELSVGGQNLFQRLHAEFGSSTGPPVEIERTAYGKITWTHLKR